MQLEKILEEIENLQDISGWDLQTVQGILDIIRKHMNDGWISVEKELPPLGRRLQATILHHEWVSDYDSPWVPQEEKIYHPAYTEVCEIYLMGVTWSYTCAEDDYTPDKAEIRPTKDLANPVAEIIAWRPFPEPYRGKEDDQNDNH